MMERIAIIGCGLIGDSWAALMTAYGHEVTAWDPSSLVMAYHLGGGEGVSKPISNILVPARKGVGPLWVHPN